MKRNTFDEMRDQTIASEKADRALMCRANGCPNRWSVETDGRFRLCSAHAWADQHRWPQITQEQLDAETERALRKANPPAPQPVDTAAVMRELRDFQCGQGDPKGWAKRLMQRHEDGEAIPARNLTLAREALGLS